MLSKQQISLHYFIPLQRIPVVGSILLCGLDDSRDDVDNRYGLIDA